MRSLEFLDGEFERVRRRRTAPPILIARAVGEEILGARIEHGRGVIDWRIDEAVVGGRIAAGGDDAGIWALRFSAFAVLILGHRFLRALPGAPRAQIMGGFGYR